MDNPKMLKYFKEPRARRDTAFARYKLLLFAASIALIVSFQGACSKKSKTEVVSTSPVRVVLLPFNVPQSNKDLHWTALAAPVLMTKTGASAQGLEIVPLWQTMPYAIENGGASRTFTQEAAANVANWLSAKWAIMGEVIPSKRGISIVVDFIPSRSTMVPFRYLKNGRPETVGEGFYDAYNQFLRYLVASPLQQSRKAQVPMTSMKDLAETLDREYGWFVSADPGKATETLKELMAKDESLARALFSPVVYSSLAEKK